MSFDYNMQRQETEFDQRTRKILNGEPVADGASWENASAEQIRAQFEKLAASDQQKADAARAKGEMDVFVKYHPEYRDHPLNARQLLNQTRTMFGTTSPTLEQAEKAYEVLLDAGLLDINQAELARQKDKRDSQIAQEIKDAGGIYTHNHPSEQEMYEMPLEELKMRGNGVIR